MKKNNYEEFMSDFANYLYAIKNVSDLYIKNIKTTVSQFLKYINIYKYDNKFENIENITLNDIRTLSNNDVHAYIFHLAKNDYTAETRAWKIEHLRAFFDFLYRIKHDIFRQPLKKIENKRKKSLQIPNYLSLNEAKSLISVYNKSDKTINIRNNAIINLCLNCGLRVSEVANLKISDFDLTSDKFLIKGKGNKERMGYLNTQSKKAILKYLEIRKKIKPKNIKDEDMLFLSNKNTKIDVSTIRRFLKKGYRNAGIDENEYSVHTLRHTCATILYKSGQDIKLIQEMLGHSSINTTKIYTHLYDKEVEKTMQDHPLANFKIKDAMEFSYNL